MTEEDHYRNLFDILDRSKNFVKGSDVLSNIFNDAFWDHIKNQLKELKKDRAAIIHPLYNLLFRQDAGNDFKKLKQLEIYLNLILQHSTMNRARANYIKSELNSFNEAQSLNMVFEISVLGRILSQIPQQEIVLYPNTAGRNDVDLKIHLLNRDIYIEVTCLSDSKYHRDIQTQMLRTSTHVTTLTEDIPKDLRRVEERIREKQPRFIPGKPSVIFLCLLGVWPVPLTEWAIKNLSNIGLVTVFDRGTWRGIYEEGCDQGCSLTKEEKDKLSDLFSDREFCLIYKD